MKSSFLLFLTAFLALTYGRELRAEAFLLAQNNLTVAQKNLAEKKEAEAKALKKYQESGFAKPAGEEYETAKTDRENAETVLDASQKAVDQLRASGTTLDPLPNGGSTYVVGADGGLPSGSPPSGTLPTAPAPAELVQPAGINGSEFRATADGTVYRQTGTFRDIGGEGKVFSNDGGLSGYKVWSNGEVNAFRGNELGYVGNHGSSSIGAIGADGAFTSNGHVAGVGPQSSMTPTIANVAASIGGSTSPSSLPILAGQVLTRGRCRGGYCVGF